MRSRQKSYGWRNLLQTIVTIKLPTMICYEKTASDNDDISDSISCAILYMHVLRINNYSIDSYEIMSHNLLYTIFFLFLFNET